MENIQTIPLVYSLWKPKTTAGDFLLVVAGSIFLAATAQIAIPLPFTPVPITGQTFGVLVIGALLGSKRGCLATVLYVMEAAVGLPVLAGATGGLAKVIGPTSGYIVGFVVSAYITGVLFESGWDRSITKAAACSAIATLIVFVCGLIRLATFVETHQVLAKGFYPFIPGAIIKIILATVCVRGWSNLIWRRAKPLA